MVQVEDEIKKLITVWSSVIISLCYCYFIPSKIKKGKLRLISLLPIFYIFTILPLYLSSAFFTAVTTFFITWLANFKLLLLAFDQGPLSWDPPNSLLLFIAITALPIKIIHPDDKINPPKPKKLPLNLATELLAFAVLIGLRDAYKEQLHPMILFLLYCCLVFLLVDILIAISNLFVRALVGLELQPPSDEPYISTSLQDFWGRRWNLIVTNTQRHTVYKPIKSATTSFAGRDWGPIPAVLATFLVSGLMHELLFYYVTRASPTWETTLFFVLHGFCVVVEAGLKKVVTDTWRWPWFLSGPLTVGFVVATSFWLFFPPLVRNGADELVIEEFKQSVGFVTRKLKLGHLF